MSRVLRAFWKSGRCRLGLLCAVVLVALAAGIFEAGKARAACNYADGTLFDISIPSYSITPSSEVVCLGEAFTFDVTVVSEPSVAGSYFYIYSDGDGKFDGGSKPYGTAASASKTWDTPGEKIVTFHAEDISPGTIGECKVDLTFTVNVCRVDLDIDSDHTHEYDGWPTGDEPTSYEDGIEASPPPEHPGLKYVVVNDFYDDETPTNGIPGYADGFNLLTSDPYDDQMVMPTYGPTNEQVFVEVLLSIPAPYSGLDTTVEFTYQASPPMAVAVSATNGLNTYIPTNGYLRLWKKDQDAERSGYAVPLGDFIASGTNYTAGQLGFTSVPGTRTFYLEAVTNTAALADQTITVEVCSTGTPSVCCEDVIRCTPIRADVDVDSNNDNGVNPPDESLVEDHYEDIGPDYTNFPGKVIGVNNGDADGDGLVDFADGYDLLGTATNIDDIATNRFAPIMFKIPEPIDLSTAWVRLEYSDSDPLGVTTDASGQYVPSPGHLRIWTEDGDQPRNGNSIAVTGGNFVPATNISATAFGFTGGTRELTYYLEAVTNSAQVADLRIVFSVDPDGPVTNPPSYIAVDAVRVTAADVSFEIDHVCTNAVHPSHEVAVSVAPDPYHKPITLELARIAGLGSEGAAIFTNSGLSTITITGSTNLVVMGTEVSDVVSNMVMTATVDGDLIFSNIFTVVDVTNLVATEELHSGVTTNDPTQFDDTNTLYICQTSNDTATLELEMTWEPTAYPASNMLWEVLLTNGSAGATQWAVTNGTFETCPTNLVWTNSASAGVINREFIIHGWFDCEPDGLYTNSEPHRTIDVKVVDFTKLVLTNSACSNAVLDVTRDDEPASTNNTLYLCESTNGTAEMDIQGWWLPESVNSNWFRWEIVTNSTATTASPQWTANDETFATNPVTVVWTNSASGESNREFLVRGWYDCDKDDNYDAEEPHRSLYVKVVDFVKLMLTNSACSNSVTDVTRPNEPASTNNTLYLCESTNGTAEMDIQGWWLPTGTDSNRFLWEFRLTNGVDDVDEWDIEEGTFATNPVSVTWTAGGDTNREFLVRGWYDCNQNGTNDVDEPHRQLYVTIIKVDLKNPIDTDGDGKIDDPATAANNQTGNEFTYTTASPGILEIPVRVKLQPDTAAVRSMFQNKMRIRMNAIDDSHTTPGGGNVQLAWDNAFSGEATAGNGVYDASDQLWKAKATFTKLPPDNDDFGSKTVTVQLLDAGGAVLCEQEVDLEVFFRRDQSNNPGAAAENWFYYWNQTAAGDAANAIWLDDAATCALVAKSPAVNTWLTYAGPRARLDFSSAVRTGLGFSHVRRDGSGVRVTGIDTFHTVVIHEQRHVQQVTDNNTLPFYQDVTGPLAEAAAAGWSFANNGAMVGTGNANYNHFDPGPDGKPGVATVDDDGDGTVDEADEFLLGVGGDVDLDPDRDMLGTEPGGNDFDGGQTLEGQAWAVETNAQDGHRQHDWGDPGKQHGPDLAAPNALGEINAYND